MSFFEIKGHKRQLEILKRAYSLNKVAHSYIFSGPEGVGKKLMAKEFAKALNCDTNTGASLIERTELDSCGTCPSCLSIEAGTHINYIFVEGEKGVIKIEKSRELLKALSYKVDRGTRVVLIDDAHTLNHAAQNALLKTLEEPPENTVLILVTSRVQDFLTTILSRCQRIQFGVIEESFIKDFLTENEGMGEAKAESIARLSDGSFKRAFQILDEGLDKKRQVYIEKFLLLMAGGTGNVEEVIKECASLYKDEGLGDFLDILKSWYRDIAVMSVGGDRFVHNTDFNDSLENDRIGFSRSTKAYSLVEEALLGITPPRYGNKQLTLEVLLMTLSGAHSVR